jgi:WD40 repeat protein
MENRKQSVALLAVLGDDTFTCGGQIMAIAWSADARYLAALSNDQHVCVFDIAHATLQARHTLDGLCHLGAVLSDGSVQAGNHQALWRLSLAADPGQLIAWDPIAPSGSWTVQTLRMDGAGRLGAVYECFQAPGRLGTQSHRIRLLDLFSGRERARIRVDTDLYGTRSWLRRNRAESLVLNGLALTPDGAWLVGLATATGGRVEGNAHGILFRWKVADGQLETRADLPLEVGFLGNAGSFVGHLSVSPDGAFLATNDYIVAISSAPSWVQRDPNKTLASAATCSTFSTPSTVISAGLHGILTQSVTASIPDTCHHSSGSWFVTDLAASPDGRHLVIADGNRLRLFDLPNLQPVGEPNGHAHPIGQLAADQQGERIIAQDGNVLVVWDVPSRRPTARVAGLTGWGFALSPDGQQLLTATRPARFLNTSDLSVLGSSTYGALVVAWPEMDQPVCVEEAVADDDEMVTLRVFRGQPLQEAGLFQAPASRCEPVVSRDGTLVLFCHDYCTFLCDLDSLQVRWQNHLSFMSAAFSADGRLVVMDALGEKDLYILDAENGVQLGTLPIHAVGYGHRLIAIAPDHLCVAIALGDHRVKVVGLSSDGRSIAVPAQQITTCHYPSVTALAWSGDGGRLFIAGADGRISIFAMADSP